jgi:hypothetical protein
LTALRAYSENRVSKRFLRARGCGLGYTDLNQLATAIWLAKNAIPRRAKAYYLGEKVVKENEYLSAMAEMR